MKNEERSTRNDNRLLVSTMKDRPALPALGPRALLLYHFCRLQLPAIDLTPDACARHLERTFAIHKSKTGQAATWDNYFDNLYPLDWFVTAACLEGKPRAWDALFASRAGRSDCLLMDALRGRAAR